MCNPLLLIRILSSPSENCLNIVFAEAEYDRKLFFQLIRYSVCRDTLVTLIWDEFSQMFGIFRFHPWSEWWTDGFSESFLWRVGASASLLRSFHHVCFWITEKNHPLGHWVYKQGGNHTADMRKLLPWWLHDYMSGQHQGEKSHQTSCQGKKQAGTLSNYLLVHIHVLTTCRLFKWCTIQSFPAYVKAPDWNSNQFKFKIFFFPCVLLDLHQIKSCQGKRGCSILLKTWKEPGASLNVWD